MWIGCVNYTRAISFDITACSKGVLAMHVQSCTLQLDDWIKNWFTFNVMVIVIVIDVVDVIAGNWQKKSFTYFFA